jgi:hypothetical protein
MHACTVREAQVVSTAARAQAPSSLMLLLAADSVVSTDMSGKMLHTILVLVLSVLLIGITSPSPFQDRGGCEGGGVTETSRHTITQRIPINNT